MCPYFRLVYISLVKFQVAANIEVITFLLRKCFPDSYFVSFLCLIFASLLESSRTEYVDDILLFHSSPAKIEGTGTRQFGFEREWRPESRKDSAPRGALDNSQNGRNSESSFEFIDSSMETSFSSRPNSQMNDIPLGARPTSFPLPLS